jgi:hypothetical protein
MRERFMLRRISFGIEPFSNLWHAVWTTLVFMASVITWALEIVYGYTIPHPYDQTSYAQDFLTMAPVAAFVFAILAGGLWVVVWREKRSL